MKNSDKISIVIPTYNEELYIERCLKSISNQDFPRSDCEIIVVDGGSKDKTLSIARKYADRIIKQKSIGVGGARNEGIRAAKYNYAVLLNGDGYCPPNLLRNALSTIKKEKAIAIPFVEVLDDNRIRAKLAQLIYLPALKIGELVSILPISNALVKRKEYLLSGGQRSGRVLGEDFEFALKLRKFGKFKCTRKAHIYISSRRFKKFGYANIMYLFVRCTVYTLWKKEIPKTDYRFGMF